MGDLRGTTLRLSQRSILVLFRALVVALLVVGLVAQPLPFLPSPTRTPEGKLRLDRKGSIVSRIGAAISRTMDWFEETVTSLARPGDAEAEEAPSELTEVISERTDRAKVFQQPNGKRYAEIYSSAIHFRDSAGKWKDIDSTFVSEGGRWRNKSNSFTLLVARQPQAEDFVRLSKGPHSISFGFDGNPTPGVVSKNKVEFKEARADIDIELVATNSGLKETLVLHSPISELSFPLSLTGLSATIADRGDIELRSSDGTLEAHIPHGYMQDSAGEEGALSEGVTYELVESNGKITEVKLLLDSVWLNDPARVWGPYASILRCRGMMLASTIRLFSRTFLILDRIHQQS